MLMGLVVASAPEDTFSIDQLIKNLLNEERLKEIGLTTLEKKIERRDQIQFFKMFKSF